MASPTTAAIYCRVSSDDQRDRGTSLDVQETSCRAFAAGQGWDVIRVEREAHTGSELHERAKLRAVRDLIRRGEADILLCHAVDRLSRKQAHIAIVADEAERAGGRLAFVTEDFDQSAIGEFIRSAKAFAGEVQRERMIESSRDGVEQRVKVERALLPGGWPLYGYQWKDPGAKQKTAYITDPDTAWAVTRIFRDAAAGVPIRAIARGLTADGVPTPGAARNLKRAGTRWMPRAVWAILRHPGYKGEGYALVNKFVRTNGHTLQSVRPRDEWVPLPAGTIPAIVDTATWATANARLGRNRSEHNRPGPRPEDALLRAGHVVCGHCGNRMFVKRITAGVFYQCQTAARYPEMCTYHSIKATDADARAWATAEALLLEPERIIAAALRLRDDGPSDMTAAELTAAEQRIAALERERERTARGIAKLDDDEAAAPLLAHLATLADQRRALIAERDALAAQQATFLADRSRIFSLAEYVRRVRDRLPTLDYAGRREALYAFGIVAHIHRREHTDERIRVTSEFDPGGPYQSACP